MAEFDVTEYSKWVEALKKMQPKVPDFRDPAKLQAEQDFLQDYFGATDYAAQDREARRMRNLQIGLSLMGRGFAGAGVRPERGEKPIAAFGRSVVAPLASDLMGITGQDYQNRMAREAAQAQEERALKLSALQNVQQREGAAYEQEVQLGQAAMELMRKDSTLLENLTYDGERMPIVQQIDSFGNPSFRSIGGQKLDPTLIRVYTEGTKPRDALFSAVTPREGNVWYALRDGEWVPNVDVQRGRVFTEANPVVGESFLQDTQTNQRLYTSGDNKNLKQEPPKGVGDDRKLEDITDFYRLNADGNRLTRADIGLEGDVPLVVQRTEVVGEGLVDHVQNSANEYVPLKDLITAKPFLNIYNKTSPITTSQWQSDAAASGTAKEPKGIRHPESITNFNRAVTAINKQHNKGYGDRAGVVFNTSLIQNHLGSWDGSSDLPLFEPLVDEETGAVTGLFERKDGEALSVQEQKQLERTLRSLFAKGALKGTDDQTIQSLFSQAVDDWLDYSAEDLGLAAKPKVGTPPPSDVEQARNIKTLAGQGKPVADDAFVVDLDNLTEQQSAKYYPLLFTARNYSDIYGKDVNELGRRGRQTLADLTESLVGSGVSANYNESVNQINLQSRLDSIRDARASVQKDSGEDKATLNQTLFVLDTLDRLEMAALRSGDPVGFFEGNITNALTRLGWTGSQTTDFVALMRTVTEGFSRNLNRHFEGKGSRPSNEDIKQIKKILPSMGNAEDFNQALVKQFRNLMENLGNQLVGQAGAVAYDDRTLEAAARQGLPVHEVVAGFNWYHPMLKQRPYDATGLMLPGPTNSSIIALKEAGILESITTLDSSGTAQIILPKMDDDGRYVVGDDVFANPADYTTMPFKTLSDIHNLVVSGLAKPPGAEISEEDGGRSDLERAAIDDWNTVYWPAIKALYGKQEWFKRYFDKLPSRTQ
jgi:hypothetical protein